MRYQVSNVWPIESSQHMLVLLKEYSLRMVSGRIQILILRGNEPHSLIGSRRTEFKILGCLKSLSPLPGTEHGEQKVLWTYYFWRPNGQRLVMSSSTLAQSCHCQKSSLDTTRSLASEPSQEAHDELEVQVYQHIKAYTKGTGPAGTQSRAIQHLWDLLFKRCHQSSSLACSSSSCLSEPYSNSKSNSKDLSIPVLDK